MPVSTVILRSDPGIKRDGTKFDGNFYTDGQWVRFQRGLPRKIGGFRAITPYLSEISRGFTNFTQQDFIYCHSGSASLLNRFTIDGTGNCSPIYDRTPTTLAPSTDNVWMFDYQYDSSTTTNYVIAHVSPNANSIENADGGQIFYGEVTGTAPLAEITIPSGRNATGGIVALHPYMFYYGTDGIIGWSRPGNPTDLSGSGSGVARVWGSKIIKGLPLRAGSGSAPAGIFWAYDAVIRATFTGGATVFQFDTIATDTSIISENSVVDYDGVFYWIGVDRFLMFNGVVREVPNTMNLNYFFDGLNKEQRSKVFVYKVTKYGEIWWAYPRGSATECTHAVIYNVRENTWYDTELPAEGRSAGSFNNYFAAPLLTAAQRSDDAFSQACITTAGSAVVTGLTTTANMYAGMRVFGTYIPETQILSIDSSTQITLVDGTGVTVGAGTATFLYGYNVWLHEQGVDQVNGSQITPILSYFETADLSNIAQNGQDVFMRITAIEPDFIQSGDMNVQVTGRSNARAPEVYSSKFYFPDTATEPYQQIVMLKEQRRELRVRFESNAIYGDYQMGQIIGHMDAGDSTVLS